MIVEAVINVLYNIFNVLTSPINIDKLPPSVTDALASALEYISTGLGIVGQFTHLTYLTVLFGLIIAVDAGVMIYKVVMWVLKKIPFLGIE